MPSIRRSLMIYFLVLMSVTLVGVGATVDRFVSSAGAAREAADTRRLRQDYEVRCRETTEKFDDELLIHAQNLARELRKEYWSAVNRSGEVWLRTQMQLALAALGDGLSAWNAATTIAATNHQGVLWSAYWLVLPSSLDDRDHPGWFQIHLPRELIGRPSPVRPARQSVELPLDTDTLDRYPSLPDDYHKHDDVQAGTEGTFRRVVVRYPLGRLNRPQSRPRESGRPPTAAPVPAGTPPPLPSLYVQYARRKSELDAILDGHRDKLDTDLAELQATTRNDSRQVLLLLLALGAGVLAALLVGSWWLVRRGLKPLKTLTTAVSRVSEKDFRLILKREDLTQELVPIHARLTDTLDALRRAFDREKQAVGDISHELRTPLAALRTTLDVSLRKPRDAEQYRATLSDCRDIARQLSKLVDRILMLASLDSGEAAPSRMPVELVEMATECLAVIRPLADSQSLTLTVEMPKELRATTDADKLREVLMNLLHNAVEYNRPGGSVTLTLQRRGQDIRMDVCDTGIGMTPDVQGKIFERFYRADASRHAVGIHAGLGLAIVKEYVARLHGTIEVQSTPEVGTRFTVIVPAVI